MTADMAWEQACRTCDVAEAALEVAERDRAAVALDIAYALITYGRVQPTLRGRFERAAARYTRAATVHREASLRVDRILADRAAAGRAALTASRVRRVA